jgi:hypothetical protein
VGVWRKQCRGYWFLWPLCVFGCISVFVVEGACVRDCRGFELCNIGLVGWTVGDACVGGRNSLVTGWGRMGGECEGREKEWVRRGRTIFWE